MLILALAIIIPFSVTIHYLRANIRLLKAMIRGDPKADYYTFEYVPASALVAPSQVAELNKFVASRFGEAALCSWSEKALTCQAGNISIPYQVVICPDSWRDHLSL